MRGWKAAVAMAAVVVLLGSAHAQVDDVSTANDGLDGVCAGAEPPCGYIVPIMDLSFPEKPKCGSGQLSFSEGPPEDCLEVMAVGESKRLDGTLKWYWEASEDGTYPKNTGEEIVITFGGTATNPRWLDVEVSCGDQAPCEFVIDDYELLVNPDNYELREDNSLWYVFERDIAVTFTRTGDPGDDDFKRIEQRSGVIPLFVKAKSTSSEPRFKEAFGVEEFRFSACTDEAIGAQVSACGADLPSASDEQSPGLPLLGALAVLGGVAWVARRRH